MIRYLSLAEVLNLHDRIISETGGAHGLRDLGMLESALGQPKQTFGGHDLYPDLAEAEILAVAAGDRTREDFEAWVREHLVDLGGQSG